LETDAHLTIFHDDVATIGFINQQFSAKGVWVLLSSNLSFLADGTEYLGWKRGFSPLAGSLLVQDAFKLEPTNLLEIISIEANKVYGENWLEIQGGDDLASNDFGGFAVHLLDITSEGRYKVYAKWLEVDLPDIDEDPPGPGPEDTPLTNDDSVVYMINHAWYGQPQVIDQTAVFDTWVELGTYYFKEGETNISIYKQSTEDTKYIVAGQVKMVRDESAIVTPGCDKTVDTCATRWDNETRFGGFGHKMPAYHPLYEEG
jgi:hypothetical protein